jgi:hypothetical protein
MYTNDKNIKLPDDETVVWKYLDLSKFVDLLLYRKLFMSRSDKFEDNMRALLANLLLRKSESFR